MADTSKSDALLQLAVEHGALNAEQAADLWSEHESAGKSVRALLLDGGYLEEDALLEMVAGYLGTRVVNLPALDIPPQVYHSVPATVARMYTVVAVEAGAGSVQLAVSDLVSPQILDELSFVLSRDVSVVLAREADVRTCVNQFYGDEDASVNDMLTALKGLEGDADAVQVGGADDEKAVEDQAGSAGLIRYVNVILYSAVNYRASDIHFEPFEKEFKIRYRVDGALYEMLPPPRRLALPIVSRLKVMSNLNIAERRLPQDGRIQISIGGRPIDLRVSTLPTQFGESVVLRVLDRSTVQLDLDNIGLPPDVREQFGRDIQRPHGILIVTGPTGSGKTTTLYSALRRVSTSEVKILTAEEPVEYDIEGLVQVPIREATGTTFPRVLRAFLRQDPDIMMIGEVRDLETAEIAIQASLTGHLVFSTLHTNNAAGAITRLIDMDIEPYLLSSTLAGVLGQRLVRVICDKCRAAFTPDDELLGRLQLTRADTGGRPFHYGRGCPACSQTGYRGRRGIFEYLVVTDAIRDLINARSPTLVLHDKAAEQGMRTMREDGVRNVLDGYTTADEVLRYT